MEPVDDAYDEEGAAALEEVLTAARTSSAAPSGSSAPTAAQPSRVAELEALVAELRAESVKLAEAVTNAEARAAAAEEKCADMSMSLDCTASLAQTEQEAMLARVAAAEKAKEELESAVRGLVEANEHAEMQTSLAEKKAAAQAVRISKLEEELKRMAAVLEQKADAASAAKYLRAAKEARNFRRFVEENGQSSLPTPPMPCSEDDSAPPRRDVLRNHDRRCDPDDTGEQAA